MPWSNIKIKVFETICYYKKCIVGFLCICKYITFIHFFLLTIELISDQVFLISVTQFSFLSLYCKFFHHRTCNIKSKKNYSFINSSLEAKKQSFFLTHKSTFFLMERRKTILSWIF